jgi:hypothetical protein
MVGGIDGEAPLNSGRRRRHNAKGQECRLVASGEADS